MGTGEGAAPPPPLVYGSPPPHLHAEDALLKRRTHFMEFFEVIWNYLDFFYFLGIFFIFIDLGTGRPQAFINGGLPYQSLWRGGGPSDRFVRGGTRDVSAERYTAPHHRHPVRAPACGSAMGRATVVHAGPPAPGRVKLYLGREGGPLEPPQIWGRVRKGAPSLFPHCKCLKLLA